MVDALTVHVRAALAARGRDPKGARAAATAVFAAIQGYYALHGASPGLTPRGSAAPAVHLLADALLGPPAAAPPAAPRRARRKP
jgi:hypothetical protein